MTYSHHPCVPLRDDDGAGYTMNIWVNLPLFSSTTSTALPASNVTVSGVNRRGSSVMVMTTLFPVPNSQPVCEASTCVEAPTRRMLKIARISRITHLPHESRLQLD